MSSRPISNRVADQFQGSLRPFFANASTCSNGHEAGAEFYPIQLTAGERQRSVIGISTILNPQMVIADETDVRLT